MAKRKVAGAITMQLSLRIDEELSQHKKEKIMKILENEEFFSITLMSITARRRFADDKGKKMIDEMIEEIKYKYPERWI